MPAEWLLTLKPSFLAEWMAVPQKEALQIQKKLAVLTEDPTPDGKQKKRLQHHDNAVCRLRSGDYRIMYTFQKPYVSVLSVRLRDEGTYRDTIEGEDLGGRDSDHAVAPPARADWTQQIDQPPSKKIEKKPLPSPITKELLAALRVPDKLFPKLLAITTQDDLLACQGVDDDVLLRIDQALVERPVEELMKQPDLQVDDLDDLIRYKEGELVGFLLKLNEEQQKFVSWGVKAAGPTLLKGGPGTGKSTVALYRVLVMIDAFRQKGADKPRILFTTYTRALRKFTEQLLEALLGDEAGCVSVKTADSIAHEVARAADASTTILEDDAVRTLFDQSVAKADFQGNALQKRAQLQAIGRLGTDYVLGEIRSVIEARRLATLEQYLEAKRPGRNVPLNKTQREAVWRVSQAFEAAVTASGKTTWQRVRASAASYLEGGGKVPSYDAVIVDEAQDLEPSMLQVLTMLCREPNRLFLTADANQSIYGAGFRWQDVHERLKFQGRTGILKANHRSTREIGEAAHAYVATGELDTEPIARGYVNNGPAPAVRAVTTTTDEVRLLERFIRTAARDLRLGIGAAAVLVPTEKSGKRIAAALAASEVPAVYMAGNELDLKSKKVKVITLKSAKGLEFPIVALAGFLDGTYPVVRGDAPPEERDEVVARERRSMFVAMTRAMRALLVVVPAKTDSPLLQGFDRTHWNLGAPIGAA